MNKRLQILSPVILLLILMMTACSTSSIPIETEETAPAASTETSDDAAALTSSAALEAQAVCTGIGLTHSITGTLEAVTARTLTLLDADRVEYCFGCSYELIQSNADELAAGCLLAIEYYGSLDGSTSAERPTAVEITVEASPDEAIRIRAEAILETMTSEERAGQLFLAHYPDTDAPQITSTLQPGGYILFSQDFRDKTADEVLTAVQNCQENANVPLLIGVDEEGGTVNRISRFTQFREQPFESPQSLYEDGGWEAILSDTVEKAALLKSLGINLNLAPVCDVSTDSSDFIYKRAFGEAAALTSEYVKTVVETMVTEQIGCVLKHFPGYGGNADTHTGSAYDERPYETFTESDFLPFEAGIEAGAGAVLVSHNIIACMDDTAPASLSEPVHRVLRNVLCFDGVIMTDDLNMQAVIDYAGAEDSAVLAVLAGNDLIISPYAQEQIRAVLNAVESGTLTQARIDESVLRILIWKINLGIIE